MILLSRTTVVIILIVFLDENTCQKLPENPCPGVFTYLQNDDDNRFYGIIKILPTKENIWTVLNVSIGTNGKVFNDDRGIKLFKSRDETAKAVQKGMYIEYGVIFPVGEEIPTVKSIQLNGKTVCNGPHIFYQNNWSFRSNFLFGRNEVRTEHISITEERYPNVSDWLYAQSIRPRPHPLTVVPTIPPITTPKPPNITKTISEVSLKPNDGSWLKNLPTCGREIMDDSPGIASIFNGVEILEKEFPWLVLVYLNKAKSFCGASLVSDRYVITAGHCVSRQKVEFLEFGRHDINAIEEGVERRYPTNIILHETYVAKQVRGDIALIEFDPIRFTDKIIPVCIWPGGKYFNETGDFIYGVVAGWGRMEDGETSIVPMKTYVNIVGLDMCRDSLKLLKDIAKEQTFCAGGQNTGPCHGDSGGGFYVMYNEIRYLRGVISHSVIDKRNKEFCLTEYYAVYVDISYYLDWLKVYLIK